MTKTLYLDHAATTPVDPRVLKTMLPYFTDHYGNPGSMHTEGLQGQNALDEARNTIANILTCHPDEIIFTSGGTESINLAIKGVTTHHRIHGGTKKHLITQKTEHHAVLETMEYLEKTGWNITYLGVDRYGMINLEELKQAITEETLLVSIMYANNEIGTIQPIKEITKICHDKGVLYHTDACQAAGYLSLDVKSLGIDMMSLNGSKIYGPKGIGILYLKKGVSITPLIHGGGQERRLRSGTENVPLIMGFAKALSLAEQEKKKEVPRLKQLSQHLIKGILSSIPKAFLNGHPTERLPNNVNISILDVEGEAVLLYLDEEKICASTGSACTSKTLDPSHVILATGLPYEAAHGSMRFTLGRTTTKEGINKLLKVLPRIIKNLRGLSPVHLNAEDFKEYLTPENYALSTKEKKR